MKDSAMNKDNNMSRRNFFKTSALLGGTTLLASTGCHFEPSNSGQEEKIYPLNEPENILYTSCLQCNTGCGIKVKLQDGTIVKVDGNPIAPHTLYPHLPAQTDPETMSKIEGAICPKGQAGIQSVYDPYRIRKVLKRAGKRGENKWISIPFDQAIEEIVKGGALFKEVAGEENRQITGINDLWALRDKKLSKEMVSEIDALTHLMKEVRKKKENESFITDAIGAFKKKFADHLDLLIDPDHPDFGPKNNQLVFAWGRLKDGRKQFIEHVFKYGFGTANLHGHTTVCQGSLYFTGKAMSEQWGYDAKSQSVKWTNGKKFYWQGDIGNAKFVIFVGASPFEGNYGPPGRTPRITNNIIEGKLKIAVVDPRLSKTASKAWKWLPIKTGTDAALALAMIQWIIEQKRFDAEFLSNANKAAAKQSNEPTYCNASWLVKIDEQGNPGKLLRSHEIGLALPEKRQALDGKEYHYELFVTMQNNQAVAFDPNDEKNPIKGDLLVDTTLQDINGKNIRVKSSLQVLYESAKEKSLQEWSTLCKISVEDIISLAREFTSYGKKAVADIHRGVSQHANGFYNCLAWNSLNLLNGNYDHVGGFIVSNAWNNKGDKSNQPFNLAKLHPNPMNSFGLNSIRYGAKYEETSIFQGYPAKRPFYPLSSDVYQEIIPSIGDQYPYPIKCLILYMGTPVYALPGGDKLIPILMDTEKLPLFIANDITIGETSLYADYIFPDLSYMERWEFQGSHPGFANKIQPIRQPVISPIPETISVFGNEMPISLESFMLAITEKLGMPGFGRDGFGKGMDFTHPDDFYLKCVANVAAGDKAGQEVPDASEEDIALFTKSRQHLHAQVFNLERWKNAVKTEDSKDWWKKSVALLIRGGRYENFEEAYKGDLVAHPYGKFVNLYSEKVATTKNSITGKVFSGIARYYEPYQDIMGNPIIDPGYDLTLITYREIMMTKSRTISNYWLLNLLPENAILMNSKDAKKYHLKNNEEVKILSASNPHGFWDLGNGNRKELIGKIKIIEGILPQTIAFALGYGHWAYGASDIVIDQQKIQGDERRSKGIHLNAAMRVDPILLNSPLTDPVGASVGFYDTKVKLVKIA